MPEPQGSSASAVSPVSAVRLKIEQALATVLVSQASAWIAVNVAWASGDYLTSLLVSGAVSIIVSIISAIGMIALVRVYRLVNTLNAYAQSAESEIAGVAMKTDLAAAEYQGSKVVGPSDLSNLTNP